MADILGLQKVKGQYEVLPYPERDPADEAKRITLATIECPDQLNHFVYNGEKDFNKKIRVLIAGGGTGDALVQWCVVLRNNPDAEIVYVDFSEASRKIAEQRLAMHGLENKPKLITDSLLNIPNLNLGKFDIINCAGVLHHLESPEAGLKVLADSLEEDGLMTVMLYGKYGRSSIYPMQEIMRYINVDAQDEQEEIDNTKGVLKCFTPRNNLFSNLSTLVDFNGNLSRDIEIYDIFLHSQDRAYTVKEVYDFAASASLKVFDFVHIETVNGYSPERYIPDQVILEKVKKLPVQQQQSIAELLNGNMNKHSFYLTRVPRKKLELDLDLIPSFPMYLPDNMNVGLAGMIRGAEGAVRIKIGDRAISFLKSPNLADIIELIDGKSTLREIFTKVMRQSKESKCNLQTLLSEFRGAFNVLENQYQIFLRKPQVPAYDNLAAYQLEKFGSFFKKADPAS